MSVYSGERSMTGRPRSKVKGQVTYNESDNGRNPKIGPRSQSLTTLQTSAVIQPRMAQLETLEAKMASIEVSLSRRRKCLMGGGTRSPRPPEQNREIENSCRKLRPNSGSNAGSTLNLHSTNMIQTPSLYDTKAERHHLESRIQRLKNDTDSTKLTIKTLKLALDKLDITDNIDTRIQQAELEFQLGKEELNLLTLLEESRTTNTRLEEIQNKKDTTKIGQQFANSLYSYVMSLSSVGRRAELIATRVPWIPTDPVFAVSQTPDQKPGLRIEWARHNTPLRTGDRLLELNGRAVPSDSSTSLANTSTSSHTLHLTILRATEKTTDFENDLSNKKNVDSSNVVNALRTELSQVKDRAGEMQRSKDELKSDNIRLTHRISYLEEQVSELLNTHNKQPTTKLQLQPQSNKQLSTTRVNNCQNVTNINIGSSNVQFYQRSNRLRPTGLRIMTEKEKKKKKKKQKDETEGEADDFDEQNKTLPLDYTSEPVPITSHSSRKRPTPPKKPIRLSLNHLNNLDKSQEGRTTSKLSINSLETASTRSSSQDITSYNRRTSLNHLHNMDSSSEARTTGKASINSLESGSCTRRSSSGHVDSVPGSRNSTVEPKILDKSSMGVGENACTRKRTHRGASVGMRWHQEIAAVAVRVRQRQAAKWC